MQLFLNGNWVWDHNPVVLKPWSPMFDTNREHMDIIPLWVQLPSLPLHYWTPDNLKNIGNPLGSFLEVDLSFMDLKDQTMVRIMVNINIRDGLAE